MIQAIRNQSEGNAITDKHTGEQRITLILANLTFNAAFAADIAAGEAVPVNPAAAGTE
jgi:hypothetical protein